MTGKDSSKYPIIFLSLVAPIIGEGLSTSTPALAFFNPITILLLAFLYGFGAVIIREITIYWKGYVHWPTVMFLGIAYGIIEEGLFLMSFLNPNFKALGPLNSYGRAWGVNWVWAMHLTLFHSIYSIFLSILLVQLSFPKKSTENWLSKRGLVIVTVIFWLGGVVWISYEMNKYDFTPPLVQYGFLILITLIIILLTKKYAVRIKLRQNSTNSSLLFILSYVIGMIYFLFPYISIDLDLPPMIPFIFQPLFVAGGMYFISRNLGTKQELRMKSLLLWIGLIGFCFILLLKSILDFVLLGIVTGLLIINANSVIKRNTDSAINLA